MAFAADLTLLQPMPLDPVRPYLVESLTADTLPVNAPQFGHECTELYNYSIALTQTLVGQGFPRKRRNSLAGCCAT